MIRKDVWKKYKFKEMLKDEIQVRFGDKFWILLTCAITGFPGGSAVKTLPLKQESQGLIPHVSKIPWRRHGNPFQYSCLKNPMDREAWRAIYNPWSRKELDTTEAT